MDERLLVKRAKRGDTAAFAELYGTIYKRLYRFALYTLGNTQDAEDVVSAAVMEAFENIGKLRKEDAFSAWMYRIVANMCEWGTLKAGNDLGLSCNVIVCNTLIENSQGK